MKRDEAEPSLRRREDDGDKGSGSAAPPVNDQAAAVHTPTDTAASLLFSQDESAAFERRWREIQATFVDEPRRSVEEADKLVTELLQQLTSSFAQERTALEQQWDQGQDVSTEDLRVALTRYRSFFQRLLAA